MLLDFHKAKFSVDLTNTLVMIWKLNKMSTYQLTHALHSLSDYYISELHMVLEVSCYCGYKIGYLVGSKELH